MNPRIATIAAFWESFCRSPLYDTGFADAARSCGACDANASREDMARALAYMTGYAQACRLAVPYLSARWEIAHLVSCAAGITLCILDDCDARNRDLSTLCDSWARELTHLLGKVAA